MPQLLHVAYIRLGYPPFRRLEHASQTRFIFVEHFREKGAVYVRERSCHRHPDHVRKLVEEMKFKINLLSRSATPPKEPQITRLSAALLDAVDLVDTILHQDSPVDMVAE